MPGLQLIHKLQEEQVGDTQGGAGVPGEEGAEGDRLELAQGRRERGASRWVRAQLTQSSVQVGLLLLYTDRCCCGPDSTAAYKQIG